MEQQQQQQQETVVAEVYSKQLAKKMKRKQAPSNMVTESGNVILAPPRPRPRINTDTRFHWNALPNEFIVPIGRGSQVPILGGSVSKLFARGVLRFPSSVQRIVFATDQKILLVLVGK